MKIITGKAKGCVLRTLEGDVTRPTSQRVKEAIFSILQFDLEGRSVLDLFSGCGQMALEALSRGASHAVLVDKSREATLIIKNNAQKSGLQADCEIYQQDFKDYLRRCHKQFDLVFIDPPYAAGLHADALSLLLQNGLLKKSSLIICESGDADVFGGDSTLASQFLIVKQSRYSISYVTVLMPNME